MDTAWGWEPCNIVDEKQAKGENKFEQIDIFTNYESLKKEQKDKKTKEEKENHLQQAVLEIKNKYGKNAILKGMNFEDGGTTIERNRQIF